MRLSRRSLPQASATAARPRTSLPPWEPAIADAPKERGYFASIPQEHHQGAHFESRLDFHHGEIDFAKRFSALPARRPFFRQVGFTDPVRHDRRPVVVRRFLPDKRKVREDLADYYNVIARLDAQTGELLGELERRGLECRSRARRGHCTRRGSMFHSRCRGRGTRSRGW